MLSHKKIINDSRRQSQAFKSAQFYCIVGQFIFLILGFSLLILGRIKYNYEITLIGGLFVLCAGIYYSFFDLKHRFIFLLFHFMVFSFLQARPVIDFFRNTPHWNDYTSEGIFFALISVPISLFSMQIGARLLEWIISHHKIQKDSIVVSQCPKNQDLRAFQLAALLLYLFCNLFFLLAQKEKISFVYQNSYDAFYVLFEPKMPWFVYAFSGMASYSLCVYLSTLPQKRNAYWVFILFIISSVSELMVGTRTMFVMNALFVFTYFCLRDVLGDTKRWIGKFETISLLVCIPPAMAGLSALVALRTHVAINFKSLFSMIVRLFYGLGSTFKTIALGYPALPFLPGEHKCYTLGYLLDRLLYGRAGKFLFGLPGFPEGNSVEYAVKGNSMAHSLSYVIKEGYLQGGGMGSSYVLECFADFGWAGIVIYSVLLGALLIGLIYLFKKSWLVRTMCLALVLNLFNIPRAEATGFLVFFISAPFWCAILGSVIGGAIFTWIQKRFSKSRKSSAQPPDAPC